MPGWKRHLLPKSTKTLTSSISVLQTGVGSQSRELRLEAVREDGRIGYYKKNLGDARWSFIEEGEALVGKVLYPDSKAPEPRTFNWVAEVDGLKIRLANFGPEVHQAQLEIEGADGVKENLLLNRQQSMILSALTGQAWVRYDVVDVDAAGSPLLGKAGQIRARISFSPDQETLTIQPSWMARIRGIGLTPWKFTREK
jgi:hypothetical protein